MVGATPSSRRSVVRSVCRYARGAVLHPSARAVRRQSRDTVTSSGGVVGSQVGITQTLKRLSRICPRRARDPVGCNPWETGLSLRAKWTSTQSLTTYRVNKNTSGWQWRRQSTLNPPLDRTPANTRLLRMQSRELPAITVVFLSAVINQRCRYQLIGRHHGIY